ncbi:Mu-like prophage major head subunit gpT family protein [Ensifer aridi]|uniref:Mu-like prophage major head subunit gpT family protein n=1 Tax=Ensifer aridi TaxID=1708715 RepID=UPI000A0FE73B|nr:Mu-like prophage major head subunit gpT family protein [Ensifer aridi]
MIVNQQNIQQVFTGFQGAFNKGFEGAATVYRDISMVVNSRTASETYGWLGAMPKMREWIGDRVVKNLQAHSFAVVNKKFESTVTVPREAIEDDQYGVFAPLFQEMGKGAAEHPDELVLALLAQGFTTKCYDGQYFFDTDHPVGYENPVSVANTDGGNGAPWFLLDCSRAIKPMIFQERIPYKLTSLDGDTDHNTFWKDEYIHGVRARSNAGFGLWQLAWGSKQTLDAAHYQTARAAMMAFKGDEGRPLGIRPDTLVVGPSLEGAALDLINAATLANGASNPWKGTAKVIVTPWLA